MDINHELVERVARARYATIHGNDGMPWADQCANIRRIFNEMSHVWLQAAADAGLLTGHAYRAEYGSMSLGTYTTLAAAKAHCDYDLHTNVDVEDDRPVWLPLAPGAEDVSELNLLSTHYDPTGYRVTPIELQTSFDATLEG